jgi:hypothetical protein
VNVPHTMAVVHSLVDQTVDTEKAASNAQKAFGGSAAPALAAEKSAAAEFSTNCHRLLSLFHLLLSLIQALAVASSSSCIMECVGV